MVQALRETHRWDRTRDRTRPEGIESGPLDGKRAPLEVIKGPFRGMNRYHLLLLVIIVLAGITLRFSMLQDSSLTTDEAEKMEAVEYYREGKLWVDLEHPPVEKYLIFISTSILGDDEWVIKLPNAILGSLVPIAVFMVASKVGKGPWPGLIAASIASLSPLMIGYSLIAKEDTPVSLLSLLTVLFLISLLEGREKEITPGGTSDGRSRLERMDPRSLDRLEVVTAVLAGVALATKFTFVLILLTWVLYAFITNRDRLRRRGPAMFTSMMVVFLLLSWYYLNPYWLVLGLGHWLWEAGTGHSTYFLGSTYDYPPIYFYTVAILGKVHPLIWVGSLSAAVVMIRSVLVGTKAQSKAHGAGTTAESKYTIITRKLGERPDIWLMIFWTLGCFIIMTFIPFKGIRYVQWILPPMIILSSTAVWRLLSWMREDVAGPIALLAVCLLMGTSTYIAYPHYQENVYLYDTDSGLRDYSGQGFRETFEWMDDNDMEGKVALRWTKLGGYYHDNVTDPIPSIERAQEEDVSYILIYLVDLQRGKHPEMAELARSDNCTLIYEVEHGDETILWLYRVTAFLSSTPL
ncbi:MAG: glycosyltransferase family 39 protein [Thermoplasmata archaeon]|nr:glycosyltransferase family 39 protein [Thermoplasmata archaeon]